jgi:hypothetical protein
MGATTDVAAQVGLSADEQPKENENVVNSLTEDLVVPEGERLEEVEVGIGLPGALAHSQECQIPLGEPQSLEQGESRFDALVQFEDANIESQKVGCQQVAPRVAPVEANG